MYCFFSPIFDESDRKKLSFGPQQKVPNLEKPIREFFRLGGKFRDFHHYFTYYSFLSNVTHPNRYITHDSLRTGEGQYNNGIFTCNALFM